MIAICQPPPESWWQKVIIGAPTLALSVAAIVISLRTYLYNRTKDQRAREQSIQDDYWIRKVVSPISIEPFLKFANELSASLPVAPGTSGPLVETYWKTHVAKLGEFGVAFRALGLIDPELDKAVADKLSAFEDLLAVYCGHLQQYLAGNGSTPPDKAEVVRGFITTTLSMLGLIQAHQTRVGTAQ